MNRKALLTISALALGLFPLGLPTHAGPAMSGMDMPQKPEARMPFSVTATLDPAAPRTGDNTLDLTILDADGKPATGLKLTATVAMTSMDMGTTHPAVTETGHGHYTTKVVFGMDGPWRVVVRNGGNKVAVLDFEAGAKTPWKSPQVKAAGTAAHGRARREDNAGHGHGRRMPSFRGRRFQAWQGHRTGGTAGMNSMPGMDMSGDQAAWPA